MRDSSRESTRDETTNEEAASVDGIGGVERIISDGGEDEMDPSESVTGPVESVSSWGKGRIAGALAAVTAAVGGGVVTYDALFGDGDDGDDEPTETDTPESAGSPAGAPTQTPTGTDTPPETTDTPSETEVPATDPPEAPSSVTATSVGDAIEVTWDPVDGAETYTLYWGTSADVSTDTGTEVADVTAPYTHTDVEAGTTYYYVVTASNDAGESPASAVSQATVEAALEFNPPESDTTTQTTVDELASALYEGENAIQSGVSEDAIEKDRVSIIRGTVTSRGGDALANVTVSTPENPDLGTTKTRADGVFDMAINGGTAVVLRFEKEGYLPVQRKFSLRPKSRTNAPDVALVQEDEKSTTVDMDADEGQLHEASAVSDGDGERQATVYVPPGTAAANSNDGTAPSSLELRATEYTVGEDGPEAMPGGLPPGVGYTYAPELTGRDAGSGTDDTTGGAGMETSAFIESSGAGDVEFDQPVIEYEYNFLDFPVGTPVPVGFYDGQRANWVPSDDGRVIEILDVDGGSATLDVDGSGEAASDARLQDLGITDDELATLADSYEAGDQLWRTPVPHFTPWDCNWSELPPEDAVPPLPEIPEIDRVLEDTPPEPPKQPRGETPQDKEDGDCDN